MLGLGVSTMTPTRTTVDSRRLSSVAPQHSAIAAHPVRQTIVNHQLLNPLPAIGKSLSVDVDACAPKGSIRLLQPVVDVWIGECICIMGQGNNSRKGYGRISSESSSGKNARISPRKIEAVREALELGLSIKKAAKLAWSELSGGRGIDKPIWVGG
jgi:hypothetical protein